MANLLQSISEMIEKISVTDRQEDSITTSVNNLHGKLTHDDCDLFVEKTFTNGSWERDTILRPLDDVDIFAVLDLNEWCDDDGNLPNPQTVLTNFKDYLNGIADYKDKVSQSRPCVTILLTKINFDVLPSFKDGDGYKIPNHDLKSWIYTNPESLSQRLESVDEYCDYELKKIIKAVKYWNRENDKLIPSFIIEEIAINIFESNKFSDLEEGIRFWFANAENSLKLDDFSTETKFNKSKDNIAEVKQKLDEAKNLYDANKESDAIKIWKEVFGKEFPTADVEEAKNFSSALSQGTLRLSTTGMLSATIGKTIASSKGYYGDSK